MKRGMFRFEKKSEDAVKVGEKIIKEANQAAKETVESASRCLESDQFNKYRRDYERTEKLVIEELMYIDKTEFDMMKYAFKVKDIVSKLRHIGSFLRAVKKDAEQGV